MGTAKFIEDIEDWVKSDSVSTKGLLDILREMKNEEHR